MAAPRKQRRQSGPTTLIVCTGDQVEDYGRAVMAAEPDPLLVLKARSLYMDRPDLFRDIKEKSDG